LLNEKAEALPMGDEPKLNERDLAAGPWFDLQHSGEAHVMDRKVQAEPSGITQNCWAGILD
jgi:hypothetical protein